MLSGSGCGRRLTRRPRVYHQVRPDYPEALYETWSCWPGWRPGTGCWRSGAPRARRRCRWPGAGSASPAWSWAASWPRWRARNLAGFDVEVVHGRFEDWRPRRAGQPGVRGHGVALDRPGGAVPAGLGGAAARRAPGPVGAGARVPRRGRSVLREIQDVYDEIGEGLPPGATCAAAGGTPDDRAGIEASGLFEVTAVRQYDWEQVYDAEEYIELLSTFSGHLAWRTGSGSGCTGRSGGGWRERPDRSVRRGWGTVLHVARRRERRYARRWRSARPAGSG